MAGKKGIKKKDHENLSEANVERVIALLNAEKPITKKEACEALNISYNTTRLAKIIQEYEDTQELNKKLRAANRGKPVQDFERTAIAEGYLSGETIKGLSEQLYRSTEFIKRVIDELGVPDASVTPEYFKPEMLPEQCVKDSFDIGEFVWSVRYGAIARIIKEMPYLASDGSGAKIYQIKVFERIDEEKMLIDGKRYAHHPKDATFGTRNAHQRAYDLGSLAHLSKHGVSIQRAIK